MVMGLGVAGQLYAGEPTELYNFVKPLDVVRLELQGTLLPSQTAEENGQGEILRRLTFKVAEQPVLRMFPQSGSWNWSGAEAVSLRLQNAMDWAITLDVVIESAGGKLLRTRLALPAGPAQTLLLPLAATSPLAHGMRAGPPMPWVRDGQRWLLAENVEGELAADQVLSVSLSMPQPDSPQSILLGRLGTRQDSLQKPLYEGLVDAYGQYTRGSWPEKVKDQQQLKNAAQQEQALLKDWLAKRPQTDKFGGMLNAGGFEASGFFHTSKRDGRWYLVTPEGNAFFSLGVNAVSPAHSQTYVEGREAMFASLPADGEPLAVHYGTGDNRSDSGANRGRAYDHGRWYDFYNANRQRIHGSADLAQWRQLSLDRLQAWGFNTLGNWSDPELVDNQRVPYTVPLSIRGDFASISTGQDWWGGMPDPFDPRFAMATERTIAIASRDRRDDPWLIGYFADNELAWAAPGSDARARYALAYATLRLTTDVPAKRAFLKQLRDKYRNQKGISKAWGIDLQAWELMEDPGFEAPLPDAAHPEIEKDLQKFLRLFADTYFKTIADALEWHAPNQLLLGGRFAITTPEAVAACAQYCDVLSFNFYSRTVQSGYDWSLLRQLDKPVLVSEFHFGSRDRGPFWGGVSEVYREEERGPAYANFLKESLKEPQLVGAHWFQYLDQPVSGRLLDGENGHLGLIGITDLPYRGFVEAVRKANLALPGQWLPAAQAKPAAQQAVAP
nr:beta-agarase [Pseudomonas sp. N040]